MPTPEIPAAPEAQKGARQQELERIRTDQKRAADEAAKLRAENPTMPVPDDLVTASASGLDPHISVAAAVTATATGIAVAMAVSKVFTFWPIQVTAVNKMLRMEHAPVAEPVS